MRALESLSIREARRLALARAGLLKPASTGLPARAAGAGLRARTCCHAVIERFGYLQLDSVSVAGARSHAIVLASRLEGLDARFAETLLAPGEPLFEYWGHEACWMPLDLYPCFAFRRRAGRAQHPWWGDLLGSHRVLADDMLERIERDGPVRSLDLEGHGGRAWWDFKLAKRLAEALWSAGALAIRERRNFQRSYDLTERVIPADVRARTLGEEDAFDTLLLKALEGHGWASTGTLAATWRLTGYRDAVLAALNRLREDGRIIACALRTGTSAMAGWVRPEDRALAGALESARPRRDRGVTLSPFDPVLWDRQRVRLLFGFDQVLEIYKPRSERRFGYYCLPVLSGERLVARVDLKAERRLGRLRVLSVHFERARKSGAGDARDNAAVQAAVARFAQAVGLGIT